MSLGCRLHLTPCSAALLSAPSRSTPPVRCSLLFADRPSDHLPVSLRWAPRVQEAQTHPLSKTLVSHPMYKQVLENMTDDTEFTR